MKFKRLKIVEQIIIISLIAVLVPSIIACFIINNVSQHSLRRELDYSAKMLAKTVENNIFTILSTEKRRLEEIIISLKHISTESQQDTFLNENHKRN